jgi:hypothetical protein
MHVLRIVSVHTTEYAAKSPFIIRQVPCDQLLEWRRKK